MERPKVACVHIGTHKTGTTTLQRFFAINRAAFNAAGVYVPLAGRHIVENGSVTPGHHAIAWDLSSADTSIHFGGLLEEVHRAEPPLALLTSEDFHPLFAQPHRLRVIVDGFASIGYTTVFLVYLRAQSHYAESLYSEYNKANFIGDFDSYVGQILKQGTYAPSPLAPTMAFEYSQMVRAFADASSVIARPYLASADPEVLLRDFLTVLGRLRGGLNVLGLRNPLPTENTSLTFRELLQAIYDVVSREHGDPKPSPAALLHEEFSRVDPALLDHRFRLISRGESLRMLDRFYSDNVTVRDEFACTIPFLSEDDIARPGDAIWASAAQQREVLSRAIGLWKAARA